MHVPSEFEADTSSLVADAQEGPPQRAADARRVGAALHLDRLQRALPGQLAREPPAAQPGAGRAPREVPEAVRRHRRQGRAAAAAAAGGGRSSRRPRPRRRRPPLRLRRLAPGGRRRPASSSRPPRPPCRPRSSTCPAGVKMRLCGHSRRPVRDGQPPRLRRTKRPRRPSTSTGPSTSADRGDQRPVRRVRCRTTTAATSKAAARTAPRAERPINAPDQPVVRVSWNEAMAFCRWLSHARPAAGHPAHRGPMGMGLPRRHGHRLRLRRYAWPTTTA